MPCDARAIDEAGRHFRKTSFQKGAVAMSVVELGICSGPGGPIASCRAHFQGVVRDVSKYRLRLHLFSSRAEDQHSK